MRVLHAMTVVCAVAAWSLLSLSGASGYDMMSAEELDQVTGANNIYKCQEQKCQTSGDQGCCETAFEGCGVWSCPAQNDDCVSQIIHNIGRCHMGTERPHCSDDQYVVKCITTKGGNMNPGGDKCDCTNLCTATRDTGCWGTE